MERIISLIFIALILTGCASTDYAKGVQANVDQFKLFSDGQLAQQASIQSCYQHNPNKSECSILAAGTNATQTLAGQPTPIRVAKTTGEILESITTVGMDKAVLIYGAKAVASAFKASQASTAAANASAASTAAAGIQAASKPPVVLTIPEGGIAAVLSP